MRRVFFTFILFASLISLPAWADCGKDTDCKGNRICESGKCVDPKVPLAAPMRAPSSSLSFDENTLAQSHARGAAVTGFVMSAVALGLAIGAELTKEDQIPSLPLGGVATLAVAISAPIIAKSGSSLRYAAGVDGAFGLRIAGWVAYGGTLLDAVVLIGLGIVDITPEDGLISVTGVLGAASLILFSIDNLNTYGEASEKLEQSKVGLSFDLPTFAPVVTPEVGTTGASLCLSGRF